MMGIRLKVTSLELLLSCLCLLAGIILGQGNEPVFIRVTEGDDAVLPCSLSTKQNIIRQLFDWRKVGQTGEKQVFLYDAGIYYNDGPPDQDEQFKGRVSHFHEQLKSGDASIKIVNIKLSDSGNYTCGFPDLQPQQTFYIKLVVESVVIKVEEGVDAVLPCSLSPTKNIKQELFAWRKVDQKDQEVFEYNKGTIYGNDSKHQDKQFKGRVSHFSDQLEYGNASIKIVNTKWSDRGNYTCDFPNLQPQQTFYIKLDVGTCPELHIIPPKDIKDWSLLQCFVRSASPKPKVEWRDSAGNTLTAEERPVPNSDIIILETTVTKTDNFSCVVTQEGICHQISKEIFVNIRGPEPAHKGVSPKPVITRLKDTKDSSLLQCEVLGAYPEPKVEWQDSAGNILPAEETQVTERDGLFYISLQTTVTKTDDFSCVVTQEEFFHQLSDVTSVYIHGPVPTHKGLTTGWIFAGVLLLVLALVVHKYRKKGRASQQQQGSTSNALMISDQTAHSTVDINHLGVDEKDEATEKLNENVTQM